MDIDINHVEWACMELNEQLTTGSIFTHNWLRTVYNEKEPASLLSCSPGDSSDNSNSKHVCASCIFQPFANFTTFISSKIRTHFYLTEMINEAC